MGQPRLPLDVTGTRIQNLFPARAQSIAVIVTSVRNSADFGAKVTIVELTPTQDMFIKFGDSTVAATSSDIFLASGGIYTYHTNGNPRIAAIRSSADGTLHITELE